MPISTSPGQPAMFNFFNFGGNARPETRDENVKESSRILAAEMEKLYPDQGFAWKDENLRHIVKEGKIKDQDGNLVTISPEARQAAQTILENGGSAAIGNGDDTIGVDEFRQTAETGLTNPNAPSAAAPSAGNPVDSFLKDLRDGKVV